MVALTIGVEIKGLDAIRASLNGMGKQVDFATAKALTRTAHAVNRGVQDAMRSTFKGGATPYSLRAMRVKAATRENLSAIVALRDDAPGKGTPWSKALGHLFNGGPRAWKRMEGAFRRIGVLPQGQIMVPGSACPLDGYGNPPRSLIVQLIAYFNAFNQQGFRANMTDKRRANLAGKRGGKITGVEYFISRGPGMWYGRQQRLPAGIWSRTGTHGSDIKPVFMFVNAGSYRKLIDLERIARSIVAKVWDVEFTAAMAEAMRTAR